MSYPKPLSEEALKKKYEVLGLKDEQLEFLHKLFLAAVNRYGSIETGELWDVYKELRELISVPRITQKNLFDFSEVVRRADVPYYVYEGDEVYDDVDRNSRKPSMRLIVNQQLIAAGYNRFNFLFNMLDVQDKFVPYAVESYFLDAAEERPRNTEQALVNFLSGLTVTQKTHVNDPSWVGKHLSEFCSDLIGGPVNTEKVKIDPAWGKKQRLDDLHIFDQFVFDKDGNMRTTAERIVGELVLRNNINGDMTQNIMIIERLLERLGVVMDESQKANYANLCQWLFMEQPLWCACGRSPSQMMKERDQEHRGISVNDENFVRKLSDPVNMRDFMLDNDIDPVEFQISLMEDPDITMDNRQKLITSIRKATTMMR